jgi:nicotinamidase/pyrazinamidase
MHALILVDIQNDFLPGGALAVPDGDAVVEVANRLARSFDRVIATQDWHPPDHRSFASQHLGRAVGDVVDLEGLPQVLWPDHCVVASPGASFASALDVAPIDHVVRKGTDRAIDSYSGFFDNGHRKATGLEALLRADRVTAVTLVGLATEYCVKFTALDARSLGFETRVVVEGVRGVNLQRSDAERALATMREAGCELVGLDRAARA